MDKILQFPAQVWHTMQKYAMLGDSRTVLCAVSGGADSVALLLALHTLGAKHGFAVCACHVNHGLRGGESQRDEDFVRDLLERIGVPYRIARRNVAAEAQRLGLGIEEAARLLRYAALREAATALDAGCIATAHTLDDTLETMVFHLARGTGARGLGGIPPVRDDIIRPLTEVTRVQVEEYLQALGQPFVTDSTNLMTEYTRNRIRHEIVPVLRSINPRCAQAAGRAARRLREDEAYLCEAARAECEKIIRRTSDGIQVDCPRFLASPRNLHGRMLQYLLRTAGASETCCTDAQVERLQALLRQQKPSARLSLPDGLCAMRQYDTMCVGTPRGTERVTETPVQAGFSGVIPHSGTKLTLSFCEAPQDFNKTFNTFYANCGTIHFASLIARARMPGDRIRLNEKSGHATLKKLMIDRCIPRQQREQMIVLSDRNGIIAVQGLGVDVARWVKNQGSVLKIQFEGETI